MKGNKLQLDGIAKHNVRILFWATLFGSVNFLEPIMTLFYFHRGLSASEVYGVTLAWCLAVLLFEVPTGAFADRFGPKASFLAGSALNIAAKACLLFGSEPMMLYLFNILWGISVTFFSGAEEALIYESLKERKKEQHMGEVMGKLNSAYFYPMIVTFLFGSYLAKDLQETQFIILIACNMLFQLFQLIVLLRVANPRSHDAFRDNPFQHVKNGFAFIRKTPNLLYIFLNFTIVFITGNLIFGKMEQPLLTDAGLPVGFLGVFYAGMALIGLLISRNIGWLQRKFSAKTLMFATGLGGTLALFAAGLFSHQLLAVSAVFIIIRTVRYIRFPIYSQLSNDYIPSQSRATTLSLLSIADSGFDLLFLTVFAGVATLGLPLVFIGSGVFCLIGMLFPIREAKLAAASHSGQTDQQA